MHILACVSTCCALNTMGSDPMVIRRESRCCGREGRCQVTLRKHATICGLFAACVAVDCQAVPFGFNGRLSAEFESAYLSTSGTLCDTRPTALQNLDWTVHLGDYGRFYGYGCFLSMLRDVADGVERLRLRHLAVEHRRDVALGGERPAQHLVRLRGFRDELVRYDVDNLTDNMVYSLRCFRVGCFHTRVVYTVTARKATLNRILQFTNGMLVRTQIKTQIKEKDGHTSRQ